MEGKFWTGLSFLLILLRCSIWFAQTLMAVVSTELCELALYVLCIQFYCSPSYFALHLENYTGASQPCILLIFTRSCSWWFDSSSFDPTAGAFLPHHAADRHASRSHNPETGTCLCAQFALRSENTRSCFFESLLFSTLEWLVQRLRYFPLTESQS